MKTLACCSVLLLALIATAAGLICWECEDVYGQSECIRTGKMVKCAPNQDFCHLQVRHGGDGRPPWYEKTCKTRKSCENNYVQNARAAWASDGSQIQCNEHFPSSVCRCCCSGDLCNQNQTSCLIVSQCPAIRAPRHGTMKCFDGFKLLSTCVFTCKRPYSLKGARRINCGAFGDWSDDVPTCMPLTCPPPMKTPEHGTMRCTNGIKHLSKCSFSCGEGYRLFGRPVVTCIDDRDGDRHGLWSGYQPTCRPLQCPKQIPLRHGSYRCTNQNYVGSVCTFSCNEEEGYELFPAGPNPRAVTCRTDEMWQPERPCCTLPCPPFAIMDMVIVLDSSSSVGEENWIKMTQFIADFINQFEIRDDSSRIAVVRYNDAVDRQNLIKLSDYPDDKEGLLKAFRNIPYDGEGTRTGSALDFVGNVLLREANGDRRLAENIVLLLTDGEAQDRVTFPANRLRRRRARIFVVPIQSGSGTINRRQIDDIAGNPSHVLNQALERGFDGLDQALVNSITSLICNKPCYNPLHHHPEDEHVP